MAAGLSACPGAVIGEDPQNVLGELDRRRGERHLPDHPGAQRRAVVVPQLHVQRVAARRDHILRHELGLERLPRSGRVRIIRRVGVDPVEQVPLPGHARTTGVVHDLEVRRLNRDRQLRRRIRRAGGRRRDLKRSC